MQKISGLVLDAYDDADHAILKSIFPGELPELIKSAARLTPRVSEGLPQDTFALVLKNGDEILRKFSMIDAGNTALSVEYFLKTGHKLPAAAQQVAAQNLSMACGVYGIQTPEPLEKIALGIGSLIGGALVVPGAAREAKSNLQAVRGSGPAIMTPEQIKGRRMQMGVQ